MNIVRSSTARSTGATVLLIDNRDGSFEADDELGHEASWVTLCEFHGNFVVHATRKLAESFMAAPEDFCEQCQYELED